MTNGRQQTVELDSTGGLRHYLDVLRRHKWIVICEFVLVVAAAAAISVLQPAKYKSTSKIVVGQGNSLPQVQFGNQIQPFVATMGDLIKTHIVARQVVRNLGVDMSPESLLSEMKVSINPATAVIRLNVTDHDRDRARLLNSEIGRVFTQVVERQFGNGVAATSNTAVQPPLTARVFDPAHVQPQRVQPRPVRNLGVAFVFGAVLGLLSAFLRDHFDRRLLTREAVERAFAVPMIGQVPFRPLNKRDRRRVVWEGSGEIAESYRNLRANLQYLSVQRPLTTILVTSAAPEQGKTTVAANLAVTIALSGARVVVVEGDLRRPSLAEAYGVEPSPVGLTSVLIGAADLDDAVREVELPTNNSPRTSHTGRLGLLLSGPLPPNPAELLSSLPMTQILDRLAIENDYVIIDSPPLLLVSDALDLARMVDGVVVVARRRRVRSDEAHELRALTQRLGIDLLGVVFTDITPLGTYGYATYGEPAEQREQRATRQGSYGVGGGELTSAVRRRGRLPRSSGDA